MIDTGRIEYEAIEAVNWSTLKQLAVSPLLYRHRISTPEPDKDAYRFGRAFHCAVLEPDSFAERWCTEPDFGDCRKKDNKAARDEWRAAHSNLEQLTDSEHERVLGMAASVLSHSIAGELLRAGASEVTMQWIDPDTGLPCKGRGDRLKTTRLLDLKKTRSVEPRKFGRDAAAYLYHGQLAWYHDGAIRSGRLPSDAGPPVIIAVEDQPPFDVLPRFLDAQAYEAGQNVYRSLIRRLKQCSDADWWPGVGPTLEPLELPPWAAGMGTMDVPDDDPFAEPEIDNE